MAGSHAIDKGGRPPSITTLDDEKVKKLESIFQVGGTIEEACSYAGISKPTYFATCKRLDGFLTRMEAAQHYADVAAKNVVVTAITKDKDLSTAKWWLEKREFKQNNQTVVNTQVNILDAVLQSAKERGIDMPEIQEAQSE